VQISYLLKKKKVIKSLVGLNPSRVSKVNFSSVDVLSSLSRPRNRLRKTLKVLHKDMSKLNKRTFKFAGKRQGDMLKLRLTDSFKHILKYNHALFMGVFNFFIKNRKAKKRRSFVRKQLFSKIKYVKSLFTTQKSNLRKKRWSPRFLQGVSNLRKRKSIKVRVKRSKNVNY